MGVGVEDIAVMPRDSLIVLWRDVVGGAPPRRLSTPLMRRILAFEMQARQHGGLSANLQRRLEGVAAGKGRAASPAIASGGRLIREWNGVSHVVDVVENGYLWRDHRYRSLSAIARAITGAHWSGPRFFGLKSRGET